MRTLLVHPEREMGSGGNLRQGQAVPGLAAEVALPHRQQAVGQPRQLVQVQKASFSSAAAPWAPGRPRADSLAMAAVGFLVGLRLARHHPPGRNVSVSSRRRQSPQRRGASTR